MNALARMRACTISWKNQCSRNFGKFIKQSDPIRRASADNISRKFRPRSGPTKSLKLIKPDGFPDFFNHTFESTCKNRGADGTARALRVVPAFNKVGVLAALNIIQASGK